MSFNINQINIPNSAGCYLMKNKQADIIYIGKAKNLPKRVKSYFSKTDLDEKTKEMVSQIADIEFFITNNEVEALVLEARLIKQYQPKYNIKLKENQPYMYIKITDEEYSRLVSVRNIEKDGKYFGPYVSGSARKAILLATARLFGLRTEKFISHSAKELYQLLSQVRNQNINNINKQEYKRNLKLAEMFLKGKKDKLAKELETRMQQASQGQNYELAKLYHNQLRAITRLAEYQLISLPKNYDQDAINYVVDNQECYLQIFHINKGLITSRSKYNLNYQSNNLNKFLADFMCQYYLIRSVPKEIIVPHKLADQELVKKYLQQQKKQSVNIVVPLRGDKKKILDLVKQNILSSLANNPLAELQRVLGLDRLPQEIDGFDISNISGQQAVGSCVHFSNGQVNKQWHRHFKIKQSKGPDDFAMMSEAIKRRYSHLQWLRPDLILIDGGKGQLSAAKQALDELDLIIPVISLAKKEEEIYQVGSSSPIVLSRRSSGLKFLQQIRDEAHRFAITYHKKLRAQDYR